jgi:hypothetical protein
LKLLWGVLKDLAFWVLVPIMLIVCGLGIGVLGNTFAIPVLTLLGGAMIVIGVIWLALFWLGISE